MDPFLRHPSPKKRLYLIELTGQSQRLRVGEALHDQPGIQIAFCRTDLKSETFEKCSILFKFKECEDLALTLHCVQPQEYIEYFEDSADGSLRAKSEPDVVIWQKRGLFKGFNLWVLTHEPLTNGLGANISPCSKARTF
jgi:hypothetical protein